MKLKNLNIGLVAWFCVSCSGSFVGTTKRPATAENNKLITDGKEVPVTSPIPSTPPAGNSSCVQNPVPGAQAKASLAGCASAPISPPAPDGPNDIIPVDSVPLPPEVKSCLGTAGIVKFSKAGLANIRSIGGSSFAPFASNKVTDDPQEYSDDPSNPAPAIVFIKIGNIGPVGSSDLELLNRNALYCFVGQSSFTIFNNTKITICKGAKLSMGAATGLGGAFGDKMGSMIGDNPSVGTQTGSKLWINCKN